MPIEMKVATRLEPLLDVLAADLERVRGNDPLRQPLVVLGTRGMERWALESIARRRGAIAHVEPVFPEGLLKMFAPPAGPSVEGGARRSSWKRERLRWEVLAALKQSQGEATFEPFLRLLGEGNGGAAGGADRSWVAMATRLADGMERMVYYRPEWVELFRRGEVPEPLRNWRREQGETEAESLWSAAYARLVQRLLASRGPLVQEWVAALAQGSEPAALSRFGASKCSVHLFANSAPSPVVLRALRVLSRSKPVILYVLEPTEAFLDGSQVKRRSNLRQLKEQAFSHPMLFGGGHQTLALRALLEREFPDALEQREPEYAEVLDESGASLLRLVQERLALAVPRGDRSFAAPAEAQTRLKQDESILVLKTVDDRRQVEVLRDRLIDLFSRREVTPDEVVVMSPRLADFAPLVRQVFEGVGLAKRSPGQAVPSIRYVMVSDAGGPLRPVAGALQLVLEAASGRFDATFCQRWLTQQAVRDSWGLPDDIAERSTDWFGMANARWGLDGPDRERRVHAVGDRMGMEAGIERMALGLLTGERPDELTERGPAVVAGGVQTRDLAAAVRAMDALAGAVRQLRSGEQGRTISDWVEVARGWLSGWFGSGKFNEDRYAVEQLMDQLAEQSADAASVEVTAAAFAEVLLNELASARQVERKSGAGVTFCSLVPMRAIPFKVVVLLGMEGSVFPRKAADDGLQPLVFVQRGSDRQPCDPDASREDRHLFLEAFGMARERFWVIANGFEPKSGEALAECAPVLELLECAALVAPGWSCEAAASEARRLLPAAATYRTAVEPPERPAPELVEAASVEPKVRLSELLAAIREPLRVFATKVLRVPLDGEETVDSSDPNGPDKLEVWALGRQWTEEILAAGSAASQAPDNGTAAKSDDVQTRLDKLEADQVAAGSIAKGYLGLGAMDDVLAQLADLDATLKRLMVREQTWRELGGSAVVTDGSDEAGVEVSAGRGGAASLVLPGRLLWSNLFDTPVVVSSSKRDRVALEAIITLALVRLASAGTVPDRLAYVSWDTTKQSYVVNGCIWPEGLDEEVWLTALLQFRAEALQRLLLASNELLFDAVTKPFAAGSWRSLLEQSLGADAAAILSAAGCLDGLFAAQKEADDSARAAGKVRAFRDAADLLDKVAEEAVKSFREAKGYYFPRELMGEVVAEPYPRSFEVVEGLSELLHADAARWAALVAFPVLQGCVQWRTATGLASSRTFHTEKVFSRAAEEANSSMTTQGAE